MVCLDMQMLSQTICFQGQNFTLKKKKGNDTFHPPLYVGYVYKLQSTMLSTFFPQKIHHYTLLQVDNIILDLALLSQHSK